MSGTPRIAGHGASAATGCHEGSREDRRLAPAAASEPRRRARSRRPVLRSRSTPVRCRACSSEVPPTPVTNGSSAGLSTCERLARRGRRAVVTIFGSGVAARGEDALTLRGGLLEQHVQRVDERRAAGLGEEQRLALAPARRDHLRAVVVDDLAVRVVFAESRCSVLRTTRSSRPAPGSPPPGCRSRPRAFRSRRGPRRRRCA